MLEFIGQTVQAQQTALLAMVVILPYNLYEKSGEADPQTFLSPVAAERGGLGGSSPPYCQV